MDNALQAIQEEYRRSKDEMEPYHALADEVVREYSGDSLERLVGYVNGQIETVYEAMLPLYASGTVNNMENLVDRMLARISRRAALSLKSGQDPRNNAYAPLVLSTLDTVQDRTDWDGQMRAIKLDALLTGLGVGRLGLASKYVYGQGAWAEKAPAGAEPDRHEQYFQQGAWSEPDRVEEGDPTLYHQSFWHWFPNLGALRAPGLHRRTYLRDLRPAIDVLRDVRFDKAARREVERFIENGQDVWGMEPYMGSMRSEVELVEQVTLIDHMSQKFTIFTPSATRPLLEYTDWPFQIARPVKLMRLSAHPRTQIPMSYALRILGPCQAINVLRSTLLRRISESAKTINLYDPDDGIGEQLLYQLQTAQSNAYIPWPQLREKLINGLPPIHVMKFVDANAPLLELMQIFDADLIKMSGQSDVSVNRNATSSRRSALEIGTQNAAEMTTTEDFIKMAERFEEECAGDMLRLIAANWGPEKWVGLLGPRKEFLLWYRLDRDRLLGEWNLQVVADSSRPLDKASEHQRFVESLDRAIALKREEWADFQAELNSQGQWKRPFNYDALYEEIFNRNDVTLAGRVLNPERNAELALELALHHGLSPAWMHPEMRRQIEQLIVQTESEQQEYIRELVYAGLPRDASGALPPFVGARPQSGPLPSLGGPGAGGARGGQPPAYAPLEESAQLGAPGGGAGMEAAMMN